MYEEEDLLPLSALQHLVFCERQCALIHVEGQWADNPLTVEGSALHQRVDSGVAESRGDLRLVRSLPLRSLRLGLSGKADAVELHRAKQRGAIVPGLPGRWNPVPVEYKRGRPKRDSSDAVQLCAQALCLEEMLRVAIPAGALFYGKTRRRLDVALDSTLRDLTERSCRRLHELVASGRTPAAVRQPKCRRCSLLERCRPGEHRRSVERYLRRVVEEV